MVSNTCRHRRIISDLVQMDLIPQLLETAIESDQRVCEKSLIFLDSLYKSIEAREEAYNSLTVPLLMNKIMRLPGAATVSVIWKHCKYGNEYRGRVLAKALEVGALQKLLLLLQVGFVSNTKDRPATPSRGD